MNNKILTGNMVAIALLVLISSSSGVDVSNNVYNELPDLIPTQISIYPFFPAGPDEYIDVLIENKGDVYAYGPFTINITVFKIIFKYFTFRIIYEDNIIKTNLEGIPPGEDKYFSVAYCSQVPAIFGFYRFNIEINCGKTIEESNYENNRVSDSYFYLFETYWYTIY